MLEADLAREYRVDLLDVWRGRLSLRKLRVLIENLPPGSASLRAMSELGDEWAGWGLLEVLVGNVYDLLAVQRHDWLKAHGGKPDKPTSILPKRKRKAVRLSADQFFAAPEQALTYLEGERGD